MRLRSCKENYNAGTVPSASKGRPLLACRELAALVAAGVRGRESV